MAYRTYAEWQPREKPEDKEKALLLLEAKKVIQRMKEIEFVPGLKRNQPLTLLDKLAVVKRTPNRSISYQAYVFLVDKFTVKFGITRDVSMRHKQLEQNNKREIKLLYAYEFEKENAAKAEVTCRMNFRGRRLTKKELPDGYTETTSIQNLDKIIEIYERFGGVRIK